MGSYPPTLSVGGRPGSVREDVYRHSRRYRNIRKRWSWPGARKRELAQGPELLGGSETADLARDRRRRSWKVLGNGGAGPGLGDGGADSGPGDGGSLPEPGDGGSLPGLGDGEAGRGSETAELTRIRRQRGWKALGDGGGAGTGLETAELARCRRPELVRVRRQRSWKWLRDGGAGQSSETVALLRAQGRRSWPGARRTEMTKQNMTRRDVETAVLARARRRPS